MGRDVIIACDFASAEQTFNFLDKFTGRKPFVKIGMELFYAEGPAIVKEIKARGHKIFLDLKLHDIPNALTSAFIKGPGRAITKRPVSCAALRTFLTSLTPEKSYSPCLGL